MIKRLYMGYDRAYYPYVRRRIRRLMAWPSAGASRVRKDERANVFGGQASKGIRWMPWLQEAMKDVVKLR